MTITSKYASPQFWIDTGDRALATFAQAGVATLTAGSAGLLDVDFAQVGSIAGLAALISVGTSIAFRGGAQETPATSDSAHGPS